VSNIEGKKHLTLLAKLSILKNNKPFIKVLSIDVAFALQWLLTIMMFPYFCIHSIGHEEWIPVMTATNLAAAIITVAILPYLGRRIQKRQIIFIGCVFLLVSAAVLWFTTGFAGVFIFQLFTGVGSGLFFSTCESMGPDVSDYTEWKTGAVVPGIITATAMFYFKFFAAISSYAVGALLSIGGYDVTLEIQSGFTSSVIRYSMVICIVACAAACMVINARLHELSAENLAFYKNDIKRRETERVELTNG
jgi:Na+/melibiose symporter-like transporter